jgi:hypothetical protein
MAASTFDAMDSRELMVGSAVRSEKLKKKGVPAEF